MNIIQNFPTKKFIQESILYYSSKIAPGLGGLLVIPFVVKYFGLNTYGEYTLYFNAVLFLGTFMTGWINQALIRFYSEFKNPSRFEQVLGYNLLLSFLFLTILSLVFIIFSEIPISNIIICLVVIILYSWYSFNLVVLQVQFRPTKVSLVENLRVIFFLGLLILGTQTKLFPINEKSVSWLLSIAGFAFLCGIFFINDIKGVMSHFKFPIAHWTYKEIKPYFSYGFPLTLWFIVSYLLLWSDRYIISYYFDLEIVGRYSAIYDLITKFYTFFYGPILLTLQPHIFSFFNNGEPKQAYRTIGFGTILYVAIFLFTFILLVFFRSFIFENILGLPQNIETKIFIPLLCSSFLWNLAMLVHKPLELRKKTILMLIAAFFAFNVNLIGNLLFIPSRGYVVAAYTTLLSSASYLVMIVIFSYRINGFKHN